MTYQWTRVRTGALLNAVASIAMLGVVVGLIGLDVVTDRDRLVRMAIENPGPILLQDALKVLSASALGLLIVAFHRRLRSESPRRIRVATGAGALAIMVLLTNAILSAYGVLHAGRMGSPAGERLNVAVGVLALVVLVSSGIWYLLSNLVALRATALPRGLCRLGIVIGAASLLPPLALISLALSIVWSLLLARHASGLDAGPTIRA
jgi:hypothetical protein